jgi:hypothetical protein
MTTDTKEIIRSLRQNQATLLQTIDDISRAISISHIIDRKNYLSLRPKFNFLQSAIFNHFQIQNEALYQMLERQATEDEDKSALRFLIQDLKELKIMTLMLVEEHPADMGDVTPKNFKRDFTDYIHAFTLRLSQEEKLLVPLLEKFKN